MSRVCREEVVHFISSLVGLVTLFGEWGEKFGTIDGPNDLPDPHSIWIFCNSQILQATQVRMKKGEILSKKAMGTMKLKKYLLGLNPKAQSLSHKAQNLNPRAPGLSLKVQGLNPEALGLCPQALSLHPEVLNQILKARSLNPRVLGLSPKALAVIPRALAMNLGVLGMNPKALGMIRRAPNLRVPGMNRRTLEMAFRILSSKPIALNLKIKVPNSRKVQRCF